MLLHKTPNHAKFRGDRLKNAGDIRDRKCLLPEKVGQSSLNFFRGCYPLRPPIKPNFIEIGQTSLEKSVKKRYLFGPSWHFFLSRTDRNMTTWVAPRSVRLKIKTISEINYIKTKNRIITYSKIRILFWEFPHPSLSCAHVCINSNLLIYKCLTMPDHRYITYSQHICGMLTDTRLALTECATHWRRESPSKWTVECWLRQTCDLTKLTCLMIFAIFWL